jgi:hypothetical protein
VPLDRLLQFVKASPQEEALIRAAYDKALAVSRIDLKDLKTDVIASRIVHIVQKGESNLASCGFRTPRFTQAALADMRLNLSPNAIWHVMSCGYGVVAAGSFQQATQE